MIAAPFNVIQFIILKNYLPSCVEEITFHKFLFFFSREKKKKCKRIALTWSFLRVGGGPCWLDINASGHLDILTLRIGL